LLGFVFTVIVLVTQPAETKITAMRARKGKNRITLIMIKYAPKKQ
jgi:hypothetical protein